MKKNFKILGLVLLFGLIVLGAKAFPFLKAMSEIEVIEFDKNLTLVLGGGGNSAILVGDKEVLVVDSKINSLCVPLSSITPWLITMISSAC